MRGELTALSQQSAWQCLRALRQIDSADHCMIASSVARRLKEAGNEARENVPPKSITIGRMCNTAIVNQSRSKEKSTSLFDKLRSNMRGTDMALISNPRRNATSTLEHVHDAQKEELRTLDHFGRASMKAAWRTTARSLWLLQDGGGTWACMHRKKCTLTRAWSVM